MIFCTVGSTHFDALVRAVDRLVGNGIICDQVIAQTGSGTYRPKHLTCFRYTPNLSPYYTKADLIICHGGVGTVFELLRIGKRFIAVPNKTLQDNHQADLLRALAEQGWCIACENIESLEEALAKDPPLRLYSTDTRLSRTVWNFFYQEQKPT